MITKTSFWKFNPRFYRGERPNVVFRELYWFLSFEFLAIFGGLALVCAFVIPAATKNQSRIKREVERFREKQVEIDPSATVNSKDRPPNTPTDSKVSGSPGANP